MSVQAMSECWGPAFPVKSELSVSAAAVRVVAIAIADVVNDAHNNEFYGSVKNLAAKVGMTRETVIRAMRHLATEGIIEIVEERPGTTTRYRWRGVSASADRGDGLGRRDTNSSQGETQENSTVELRCDGEPTVNQRANAIAKGYCDWYYLKHGTQPVNTFLAFRAVIARALKAGHADASVKRALVALHDAGTPMSGESLDRQLTRPNARPKRAGGLEALGFAPDEAKRIREQPELSRAELEAMRDAEDEARFQARQQEELDRVARLSRKELNQ